MKTHCKRGHARTPENVNRSGQCRMCVAAYWPEYRKKNPQKVAYKPVCNPRKRGSKGLSEERKALLQSCIEDCWPIRQIIATHGFGTSTIRKYHPGYHGMTDPKEAGALSQLVQKASRKIGSHL